MRSKNAPEPSFPSGRAPLDVQDDRRWTGTPDHETAYYQPDHGIILRGTWYFEPVPLEGPVYSGDRLIYRSGILAHELVHAVQEGADNLLLPLWAREGTATTIANIWTKQQYGGTMEWLNVTVSEPLHLPKNPYTRWKFFDALFRDLGAADPAAFGFGLLSEKGPEEPGASLDWLDGYLTSKSAPALADYFPDYVRTHASDPSYYTTTIDPAPVIANARPDTEEVSPSVSRPIKAAAADRSEASLTFSGGWSAADPWDTLALIRLDIPRAATPDDLRLIVDKQIFDAAKSYQAVVAVQDGMQWSTPFHVTNMAAKPSLSREQTYNPRLRVSPLHLSLPPCAIVGQPTRIDLNTSAADFDPAEVAPLVAPYLKAASGTIGPDLTYTATKAGEDEITLTTFAPDGSTRTATRTIRVNTAACMVRMVFDGGTATYSAVGDYTEFLDTRSGSALYFGQDRLAAWEGGWMDLPPEARDMILEGIKGTYDPMIEATGGQGVGSEGQETITRFPQAMRQTFGNAWVQNALTETKPEPEPCPPGWGGGCTRLKGAVDNEKSVNIDILYDGTGLPITVTMNGATLSFEMGDFPIRRPPGW